MKKPTLTFIIVTLLIAITFVFLSKILFFKPKLELDQKNKSQNKTIKNSEIKEDVIYNDLLSDHIHEMIYYDYYSKKVEKLKVEKLFNFVKKHPYPGIFLRLISMWKNEKNKNLIDLNLIGWLYLNDKKALIKELITLSKETSYMDLGFASLSEIFHLVKQQKEFIPYLLQGIQSKNQSTVYYSILCIQSLKKPYSQQILNNLLGLINNRNNPDISAKALHALFLDKHYKEYSVLESAIQSSNKEILDTTVYIIFKNRIKELYPDLFSKDNISLLLNKIITRYLRVFVIPGGLDFLILILNDENKKEIIEVIRSISTYKDDMKVVNSLIGIIDSEISIQAEVIRALRKVTNKKFGYRFGLSHKKNKRAIDSWKSLKEQMQ